MGLKSLLGRTARFHGTPEPKGTKRHAELIERGSSTEMEEMEKGPKMSIWRGTPCHQHTAYPAHRSTKSLKRKTLQSPSECYEMEVPESGVDSDSGAWDD